ncbi:MAG TPA: RNB domain-containing ribonuclease [Steroidobacteraceae bacterium]|nr:RNB domain-containing ribonuclease [Steroidobacteraceae bacterium]
MSTNPPNGIDLKSIARRAMIERGLEPDLPAAAAAQLQSINAPAIEHGPQIRDLRSLLWCSIDNDDSRDLDQLSVAAPLAAGAVRILIAIADVDATLAAGTPLDEHARRNTTSVYTAAQVFPMLPERLSTDLTCLAAGQERLGVVIDMTIAPDGAVTASEVYRALVVNRAKLAYDSVAAWLDGKAPPPPAVAAVAGMDQQLRMQDGVAQVLKRVRRAAGALALTTLEARAVYEGAALIDLKPDEDNRAKELIEFFMIAANGVVARFLEGHRSSSLRRVLRKPERWDRIVALARGCGESLPPAADARALNDFLVKRQQAAPAHFPDLSLAVVKLLGAGAYVLKRAGQPAEGHFGLAVDDYTHATAPNRRYPDVITQRLLKAALAGRQAPYGDDELRLLGAHCTEQEGNAAKVERQVRKSAAALLLQSRIGQQFDAMVTGASEKGTWVRISQPLAEGRLVQGFQGLDVGDQVRVRLLRTDVQRGFIDFARSG